MNKTKRIFFGAVIVGLLGAILLPVYLDNRDIRSKEDNTAEEITLMKGMHIVGEDLKPGIYDIICISESGLYTSNIFDKGEKILGEELFDDTQFEIEEGTFQLVPSKFEAIKPNAEGNYELLYAGIYKTGLEIPKGTYKIYFTGNIPSDRIQVAITKNWKNYKDTLTVIDNSASKEQLVTLEDGYQVYVERKENESGEQEPNIKVILEPQ